MSKRTLIATGIIAVIIVGGLVWALLTKNQGPRSLLGPTGTTTKTKGAAEKEETYTDTSGFSFKHPESIVVADKTPNGDAYYTLLSLTSEAKKDGSLTITIMDTNFKTLDDWLAKDSTAPSGATLAGAISLGGISAKQYTKSGKLWTIAIDKGILYLIEGPKDGDYWDKVQDLAASSFTTAKPEASKSAPSDSGAIYEEEEVIE
ncbi:MAG: hypothetical protein Q7S60_01780 [bacterium]|nr:hypothetical protein [bacterium]